MRERTTRLLLVIASILFSLGCLELGCRLGQGPRGLLDWSNIVWKVRNTNDPTAPTCDHISDPQVGWLPCRRFASSTYNTDADGYRPMPRLFAEAEVQPPILAVGDSFTEGYEVADQETYPFYLQARSGPRVINGGVIGFGLDQTVLRAEILALSLKPAAIILSFIPDDVRRMEMSRIWSEENPHFELVADRLELKGVPVPTNPNPSNALNIWQQLFGWSVLVDVVVDRLGWRELWLTNDVRVLAKGEGLKLSCPLMKRLSKLDLPVIVVAQYDKMTWNSGLEYMAEEHSKANTVLRCAADAGFATLDTFDVVKHAIEVRGLDMLYIWMHHSAEGNHLISEMIAAELSQHPRLSR
jgi:hypothetical protein